MSILLREHPQRYREKNQFSVSKDDPLKYLDARHVFDQFKFISLLNAIGDRSYTPENLQSFARFLVKSYYNETGETPPVVSEKSGADKKTGEVEDAAMHDEL